MYQKKIKKVSVLVVILVYLFSLLAGNTAFAQSLSKNPNQLQIQNQNQKILSASKAELADQAELDQVNSAINTVSEDLSVAVQNDWLAIALSKADVSFDKSAYSAQAIDKLVNEMNKTPFTVTDIERMVIGLASVDVDVSNIKNNDGKNAIDLICESELQQGINAKVFALVALDAKGYETKTEYLWNRETLIQSILDSQVAGGGWTFFGTEIDVDMTSMVITALAPYKNNQNVVSAIENALTLISNIQNTQDGEFYQTWDSSTTSNSNTDATVITALSTWGCGVQDSKFIKNDKNLLDILLTYKNGNKFEFSHGEGANDYATEQVFRALVAYKLFLTNSKTIFDFVPTNVYIRIEGKDSSILPITLVQVYQANSSEKVIAMDIFKDVLSDNDKTYVTTPSDWGEYISSIDGLAAGSAENPNSAWMYALNNENPPVGIDACELKNNDVITVYYVADYITSVFSFFDQTNFSINQSSSVILDLEGLTGYPSVKAPIADAVLYVDKVGDNKGEKEAIAIEKIITDKDGKASIIFHEAGTYRICAKKITDGKNILTRSYAEVVVAKINTAVVNDLPDASDWSKQAIQRIFDIGFMKGDGEELFGPQRDISRAEVVATLMRFMNIDPSYSGQSKFTDVSESDWYFNYVNKSAEINLVFGRSATEFAPNEAITREELATLLDRILQLSGDGIESVNITDINDVSVYAVDSVRKVYSKGLLVGYDGIFTPSGKVSREMMAVLIERLFDVYYV